MENARQRNTGQKKIALAEGNPPLGLCDWILSCLLCLCNFDTQTDVRVCMENASQGNNAWKNIALADWILCVVFLILQFRNNFRLSMASALSNTTRPLALLSPPSVPTLSPFPFLSFLPLSSLFSIPSLILLFVFVIGPCLV